MTDAARGKVEGIWNPGLQTAGHAAPDSFVAALSGSALPSLLRRPIASRLGLVRGQARRVGPVAAFGDGRECHGGGGAAAAAGEGSASREIRPTRRAARPGRASGHCDSTCVLFSAAHTKVIRTECRSMSWYLSGGEIISSFFLTCASSNSTAFSPISRAGFRIAVIGGER